MIFDYKLIYQKTRGWEFSQLYILYDKVFYINDV